MGEADRSASQAEVEATLRDLLGRNLLEMSPSTAWLQTRAENGLLN